MKGFLSNAGLIAWKNFEATGKIGFFMLYNAIENPERVLYRITDENKEIENGYVK